MQHVRQVAKLLLDLKELVGILEGETTAARYDPIVKLRRQLVELCGGDVRCVKWSGRGGGCHNEHTVYLSGNRVKNKALRGC